MGIRPGAVVDLSTAEAVRPRPGVMLPDRIRSWLLRHMDASHQEHMTYEDSVLLCADEYGCLTLQDAKRLLEEHGSDYWEAHKDGMPLTLNAEKLLNWLGY